MMRWVHGLALGAIAALALLMLSPVLPGVFLFIGGNPGIVGLVTAVVMFATATAVIAEHKGRSVGGWFLLGALLPVAFLPAVLLLPSCKPRCEACRKHVEPDARLCPYCRTERALLLDRRA
jgi:hypothetical protein